jgi:hypothetical protein
MAAMIHISKVCKMENVKHVNVYAIIIVLCIS